MRAFFLLILAVAVSMLVIPLAMRLAPLLGMVDKPDARKVHREPVPRVGGWGIVAGCLLPLLALDASNPLLQSWAAGCGVLLLFGAWDDAREIGHWPKFAGQLIAAGLVVFHGGLFITRLPFFEGDVLSPLVGQLFTMFALIGVINAINHSDGLDGLAGGETVLSFIAIAFLGHVAGSMLVTDVAIAAIGGTVGFLRYNTHPARVFMGDSGSQCLGLTAGFLVVYLVQVANPAASAALPLLLLGLPLSDILVVLYKRATSRMNWFKATRNHVHHRLLDLGFSHFQSVVAIYSLQLLLVVCAVAQRYTSDIVVVGTYFAIVGLMFAALAYAERTDWRLHGDLSAGVPGGFAVGRGQAGAVSRRTLLWSIALAVSGLCLFASLWAREIPRDLGVLAAALAVAIAIATATRLRSQPAALRVAAYIAATFSVWLFVHYPRQTAVPLDATATTVICLLAVAVGAFVRFMSDQRFGATPTDYLVVFALLALTLFGRFTQAGIDTGNTLQFVTYAIVLFYCCEILVSHFERWRFVLGGSTFAVLLILALRSLYTPI